MRKLIIKCCFVVVCWLLPNIVLAQYTDTKELTKSFKVTSETQIEITNKYGKIDIKPWNKDSVVFEIKIRVEEKKLSKLEEAVRGIDFDVTNNDHFVIVRTNVDKNKNSLGKEIKRFKETILKSDGNIQVDFTIWMPNTNDLKIENKYGDVYLGNYYGDVEINLSNGNLKAHDFDGETKLVMNFADANINSIKNGQLNCNFSDMYIKKCDELDIKSKSSDFELNEIQNLYTESRRDKFRIRKVESVKAKSSFSIFRVEELLDRLNLRAEYGSLELEKAALDFSNILIESKSTDLNLYFSEEANFDFEFKLTDVENDFCNKVNILEEETMGAKGEKTTIIGNYGEKTENNKKLSITADSGELNIRTE